MYFTAPKARYPLPHQSPTRRATVQVQFLLQIPCHFIAAIKRREGRETSNVPVCGSRPTCTVPSFKHPTLSHSHEVLPDSAARLSPAPFPRVPPRGELSEARPCWNRAERHEATGPRGSDSGQNVPALGLGELPHLTGGAAARHRGGHPRPHSSASTD